MQLRYFVLTIIATLMLSACNTSTSEQEKPQVIKPDYSERNKNAMAHIIAYDVYGSFLGEANGVYVAPDIVLTTMSWIKGAQKAKLNPIGSKQTFNVFGFSAYNIDDDIVALRVERKVSSDKLPPIVNIDAIAGKGLHYLTVDNRKRIVKNNIDIDTLGVITTSIPSGTPIFDEDGCIYGMVGRNNDLITASTIKEILPRVNNIHESIYQMRLKSNKVYPKASTIAGFTLNTSMGKISMRLFDETIEYKENIIRLVTDHFYDSLLVHRVLENYLIQTGAADSRNAGPDAQVGWQGPGYTIPMHIVPTLFHKRGMVAASKLPQDHNSSNRSDGSQFYIVAGRTFSNKDLDDIEKEYHKKFSPAQREAYTTVGGAPYLDGDYTVFAEVTSGMDVVDKIAALPLNGDRPIKDVRIYKATLIRK
ncbi:MAG: peptidylprolyl isomerase [Bacteroidia bacterium]|nr:peptidylprolyl isomerase [Bacteroidia bacterium]